MTNGLTFQLWLDLFMYVNRIISEGAGQKSVTDPYSFNPDLGFLMNLDPDPDIDDQQ
jgi:hypothetical protein